MKSLMTAAILAIAATGLSAGQSDRYHDMRLDTSKPKVRTDAPKPVRKVQPAVTRSTVDQDRPKPAEKPGYAYANPYGVGPNNDSR
jgi:hypothetical protein